MMKLAGMGLLAPAISTTPASANAVNIRTHRGNYARTGVMPGPAPDPTRPIVAKWTVDNNEWQLSSPLLFDGVVYASESADDMFAIDAITGEVITTYDAGWGSMTTPTIADGMLIYSMGGNAIAVVDLATREEKAIAVREGIVQSIAAVDGVLYFGSKDGSIYSISIDSGEDIWSRSLTSEGMMSTSVSFVDETLYVGTTAGDTYALDAQDGSTIWRTPTREQFRTNIAVEGSTAYLSCIQGSVHALDINTGESLWETEIPEKVNSSPAVSGGKVFIGCHDHHLYALDAESGDIVWTFESGGWIEGDSVVVDSTVIFGSFDHHIYALDTESGDELWRFKADEPVFTSQWVEDGMVLATDGRDKVYCLANE